jgi:CheY-like chemotaxis protein
MSDKYTVLCVEDNLDMQEMLQFILQKAGYHTEFANNGLEGVQKTADVRPDLILMDVMMPDMSGIEAVKAIRRKPEHQHIPIIILSSYTAGNLIDEALDAGAVTYLEKTILPKKLAEVVKSYLESAT